MNEEEGNHMHHIRTLTTAGSHQLYRGLPYVGTLKSEIYGGG